MAALLHACPLIADHHPPSSLTIIIYGVARARLGAKIRKGL
jgi:hypothetical protein